jgi:hypothetical protein
VKSVAGFRFRVHHHVTSAIIDRVLNPQLALGSLLTQICFNKFPIMIQTIKDQIREAFAKRGLLLVQYAHGHRAERLRNILRVRQSSRSLLLNPCEAAQLISAVKAAEKVPGALAEVGVASGTSARMIAENSPHKVLHLFDTFSGLPKPTDLDSKKFAESDFNFKLDQVRNYLDGLHVVFHQGMFPSENRQRS